MSNKYYISDIKYQKKSRTLEIEWTIDVVWYFFDVPKSVYEELKASEDTEEFYRQHIMEKFKGRQKWRSLDELLSICADILLIDDLSQGVKATNCCNESAIHLSSSWGDIEAVKLLASLGAEFDAPDDCGCSPLYDAVMFNNLEVAQYLLRLGANPHSTNDIGYTPYELALSNSTSEIIEAFKEYV
jgi:hypothetical protein